MTMKLKKTGRLTPNMKWVLQGLCEGKPFDHGCSGRSEHGARGQTLIALHMRGLVDASNQPTDAARAMFAPAETA